MRGMIRAVWIGGLLSTMAACAQQQAATPGNGATQTDAPAPISQLSDGWHSVDPGGATTCSDGSPYRFFVRRGDPQKLLVFFQGGGACWTSATCDPTRRPTYTVNIPDGYQPDPFGIFNYDNPDNPFVDYSVVFAPYCTGDVHLGARSAQYAAVEEGGEPFIVHHQGRANAASVMDWAARNVPQPAQVFVTGSSAGAIPSPFYASLLADQYPQAAVAHLGDGAGGYRQINGNTRPDQNWGTFDYLNSERGFEQVEPEGFNYEQLYIAAAKANPDILFAEYDAAEDAVQKQFLALGGVKDVVLQDALEANHADITAEVPNFRAFISGGTSHTILRRPEFYMYAADGTSVRDWVANLAAHSDVRNITCSNCAEDTYIGGELAEPMRTLWANWEDPAQQYVEPFQIFDNLYYVGIDWVAAYALTTDEGIILIDTLYGKWTRTLLENLRKVGLDPADVKYVINTHGHFDHAGGTALMQSRYGARVVMSAEDWALAAEQPSLAQFYMPVPSMDIVAADGDAIELGSTRVELFKTPGHTEGVLTLRYQVQDGKDSYTAVTLGGVGLNFSGVQRTRAYIDSYQRLLREADGVSVSLPNHAYMGEVFARADRLSRRSAGESHPFVDPQFYRDSLARFIDNAQQKLQAELAGTARDPLDELTDVQVAP